MHNLNFDIRSTLTEFDIDSVLLTELSKTNAIVNDSRIVKDGDIFCAVVGHALDGRQYIEKAIELGAALIISQCQNDKLHGQVLHKQHAKKTVPVVQFYQLNDHLFRLCELYYQTPQKALTMIGITGTNGKTSTSQLIAQLISKVNKTCAVIGTNGAGVLPTLTPIVNTTPGASELMTLLTNFRAENISHVSMEVSSHALAQHRVEGCLFDIAVFTNLSRDHLDYHQTMAAYEQAKLAIFSQSNDQVAVVNGDDEVIQRWLKNKPSQPITVYGKTPSVSAFGQYLYAKNIIAHHHGTDFELDTPTKSYKITSPLIGDFNIDNLLAAIATVNAVGVTLEEIQSVISQLEATTGRMELFSAPNTSSTVVDYAHTPDALEKALLACRAHCQGKLWVVFGCGGDRDKGKRPEMGEIAERLADEVIITNDNPRTEAPEFIVADILKGLNKPERATIMLDREQAVLTTIKTASETDIVLLAGKGHEDYIIIGDRTIAYNERELVSNYYSQIENNKAGL